MRHILTYLVKGYRFFLSPWLGNSCRFEPTCSQYALDALDQYGALRGTILTTWRLVRCSPWCEGGHDPIPSPARKEQVNTGVFSRWLTSPRSSNIKSESTQTKK